MKIKEFLKKNIVFLLPGLLLLCGLLLLFGNRGDGKEDAGYSEELSSGLRKMIDAVNGESGAEVMVTLENEYEAVYASSSLVSRKSPTVRGIAVICPGGDDPKKQLKIVSLIRAVAGIGSDKISVCGTGKP